MPLMLLLALHAAPGDRATDDEVRRAMKHWGVPGCAVVIVRDGKVVYCKGHGVEKQGSDRPVSVDTLFPLSSCSKAFTTTAIARLADQGKLSWDDPVRKHLPWFRLSDPLVEREATLRDLACHRTGLGPNELLWHRAPWGPEEAVRRLRHLPLSRPFRTTLQYQSTAFTAAGLAAARAAGLSWSELIRDRVLAPLGMKSTFTNFRDAHESGSLAVGHRVVFRRTESIIGPDSPHADPAVSIWSSAADMGKWLRYQLAANESLRRTHEPQMVIRLSPSQQSVFPDTHQMSYALGWAVHDYRGLRLLSHGGSIDGFRCHITLVPERGVGIAVLCNLERSPMPLALAHTLLDSELGFPRRDWHELHSVLRLRLLADALAQRRERRHGTTPSRELAAYVSEYEHPAYGTVRIGLSRGKLAWRWRDENVPLEHYHHDTFSLDSELLPDTRISFSLDSAGAVAEFRIQAIPDIVFRKPRSKPR